MVHDHDEADEVSRVFSHLVSHTDLIFFQFFNVNLYR